MDDNQRNSNFSSQSGNSEPIHANQELQQPEKNVNAAHKQQAAQVSGIEPEQANKNLHTQPKQKRTSYPFIELRFDDGKHLHAHPDVSKFSKRIATAIKTSISQDLDHCVVPVPGLKYDAVRKLLEWTNYHRNDVIENISTVKSRLPMWDFKFLQMGPQEQIDLLLTATAMDIKPLMEMCSKMIFWDPCYQPQEYGEESE